MAVVVTVSVIPRIYLSCTVSCSLYSTSKSFSLQNRRVIISSLSALSATVLNLSSNSEKCWSKPASSFEEISGSGGVKALDIRLGNGDVPVTGDQVSIHYYGRLAAKQGWRFDSTYDHKDETGEPIPFTFTLGSGKVISGIEAAVKSMKVGSVRRVVIPPSQGYLNTSQEPLPPNVNAKDISEGDTKLFVASPL